MNMKVTYSLLSWMPSSLTIIDIILTNDLYKYINNLDGHLGDLQLSHGRFCDASFDFYGYGKNF
jgi:hypothetical protein